MEERSLPLLLNSSSPSVKPEPPLPFLFINELEENDPNAKSKYGFAVRSHVRRRAITERRRKNAAPKIKRELLQRESSL